MSFYQTKEAGHQCMPSLSYFYYVLRWVSGATVTRNPYSVHLSHCVLRQDTSFALPDDGGQRSRWCRLYGSLNSVSLPLGSFGYNVAYHCLCECVYEWVDG
ncbi:hypothetical protein AMECASPLE_027839 [Ameca splendens]|uniref:Uncharacterized protein n=1 Tax=Ameca splendens TaxID=208324 RepID=A0ABV0Z378_9TELE